MLDALVTQNQLDQELIDRLVAGSEMPVRSYRVTPGVLTPTGAQGWRVVIVRQIGLEFPPSGNGTIRFTGTDQTLRETDVLDYPTLSFAQQALNAGIAEPATDIGANPIWSAAIGKLDLPVPIDRMAVTFAPPPGRGGGGFAGPGYKLTATETFLLEVIDSELTVTALAYQNSSILSHLEARPENRNPDAYRHLSAAPFPWTLPFDLPLEETRALLDKLGVSRRTLLEMALPDGPMTDRLTAEILGLSSSEASIIAPPPGAAAPIWQIWGLGEVTNRIWDEQAGVERTGSWSQVLSRVSMVMQQARLTHRELLDVLQTLFMAAARPTIAPDDECEPSKLTLTAADLEASLRLIHRFVRLWRRTGWTMRELDRVLVVFNRTLDEAALRGVALVQVMHERLRIPIVNLAAMLGSLEIASWKKNTDEGAPIERSLYDQLFRQTALRGSPGFPRFALDATGRLPEPTLDANGDQAPGDTVAAHAAFIASAVGLSPQERRSRSRCRPT